MSIMEQRKSRKILQGVVTGRSGDKSIKVIYFYKIPHALYRKEVRRRTVLHVHDEDNRCSLGDKVEVMETRALSKMKRWRVIRVIEKMPISE
ncbi:MAG: 30S ribosomal protein S17 [Puniceicoccales bacterium]|jgi:small subunit ribosomal protein S17|nr:30S ribosomal protein S17 [Puniceicoccales bacterium]